jgi:sugar/nucleoside kinase (ribokinase family)
MKREFDICGLGNAIVDIFLDVSEAEFATLGFDRGTMTLVDHAEQSKLLSTFEKAGKLQLASGGSVANSIIAFSQLGGNGAFIGCVGDDRYGLHYANEFTELHIDIGNPILVGQQTGTCVAVITPDAERTMRTCLAVSSKLAAEHVEARRIENADWLFIEGYVFANPETGQHAIREAIRIAKQAGTKIAITCSEAFIPQVFGDALHEALRSTDLFFCNGPESMSVTGAASTSEAFEKLKSIVPNCVVTDGPNGAFIRYEGKEFHEAAHVCKPKDLTGAGDMFAGAFLYGITHDYEPQVAARAANFLCMKVITQVGARLHHGAKDFWKQAIS